MTKPRGDQGALDTFADGTFRRAAIQDATDGHRIGGCVDRDPPKLVGR